MAGIMAWALALLCVRLRDMIVLKTLAEGLAFLVTLGGAIFLVVVL